MKTVIYIVFFSFIQLSAAFAQTNTPDYNKLTTEVYEMFDINENLRMYENRDIDGLVNRFTKDGSLKVPGAPRIPLYHNRCGWLWASPTSRWYDNVSSQEDLIEVLEKHRAGSARSRLPH